MGGYGAKSVKGSGGVSSELRARLRNASDEELVRSIPRQAVHRAFMKTLNRLGGNAETAKIMAQDTALDKAFQAELKRRGLK